MLVALSKEERWEEAVATFEDKKRSADTRPDVSCYGTMLHVCESAGFSKQVCCVVRVRFFFFVMDRGLGPGLGTVLRPGLGTVFGPGLGTVLGGRDWKRCSDRDWQRCSGAGIGTAFEPALGTVFGPGLGTRFGTGIDNRIEIRIGIGIGIKV